ATPFALPELPVSVSIDRVAADRITLGPALLGQPVEGRLEASAQLVGGEGQANLTLERTDGTLGTLALTGDYSNATGNLNLDLRADEAAGGLAATLLDLPGQPAVQASISGSGTLADFTADIDISTDGITRLAGDVTLAQPDQTQTFAANLSGNPAPLFLPAYAAFFGEDVALRVEGSRSPTGQTDLSTLQIDTRALTLGGSVSIAPDGLPLRIDLSGTMADPDGKPVLLPLADVPETRVQRADLRLQFDAARSDDWQADFTLDDLTSPSFNARSLTLTGSGLIARSESGNQIDAAFAYAADGLAPRDPALATALGPSIAGNIGLNWRAADDALSISRLTVIGEGIDLSATGEVSGLSAGLQTKGRIAVISDDFSRYAALAGQPLAGSGTATVVGSFTPLGGAFDGTVALSGRNLAIGIPEVDALLSGASRLRLDVVRDETGTTLRDLSLTAQTLTASASGTIATAGSDLDATLNFTDLSALGGPYRGSLNATASFTGTPDAGQITLQGEGQALGIGTPEVDSLLSGTSQTALNATIRDGGLDLSTFTFTAANLRAAVTGRIDTTAGHLLSADLQFPDLSALGPQ
ncbi:MAG: translocation/assembly module TamB domain-containing protein, partial [Paracoccaceae bacterium]